MERSLAFRESSQADRRESQFEDIEVEIDLENFGLSDDDDVRFSRLKADQNHQMSSYKPVSGSVCASFTSQVESLYQSEPTLPSSICKEKTENDRNSLRFEAVKDLSDRPKNGVIYKEVSANVKRIMERLEYLLKVEERFTIDEAIEIADAAQVLKILRRPEVEITNVVLAGKMTHEGAVMIFEAEKLIQKGHNLLDRGKLILQLANLKPDSPQRPPIRRLKSF